LLIEWSKGAGEDKEACFGLGGLDVSAKAVINRYIIWFH
jgi:hypothetical protein